MASPVMLSDPTGMFSMTYAEVGLLAAIVTTAFFIVAPTVNLLYHRAAAFGQRVEANPAQIAEVIAEMQKPRWDQARLAEGAPRMSDLAYELGQNNVTVEVFRPAGNMAGVEFLLNGRSIYVSQSVMERSNATIALVLYGEYQHIRGRIDNQAAQDEFAAVRRVLPVIERKPYIMGLHHEGTRNDP